MLGKIIKLSLLALFGVLINQIFQMRMVQKMMYSKKSIFHLNKKTMHPIKKLQKGFVRSKHHTFSPF